MKTDRPHGMSQLDYLWTHFGSFEVLSEPSAVPRDDAVLTEQALANLLEKAKEGGIVTLTYEENPDKEGTMRLTGTSLNGTVLTQVEMPKEVHVKSFTHRTVTQEDIDNGCKFPITSKVLSLVLTDGTEFLISLQELDLVIQGADTDTVSTSVKNGLVKSSLKIDKINNQNEIVKLKKSEAGLYAHLQIQDKDTGIKLSATDHGLKGIIPLGSTEYQIRFEQMTLSEYQALEKKRGGTVYFISDKPFIYLGNRRYGVDMEPGEVPIVSLVYDKDHMLLSYKKADGSDIQHIHLGPADEEYPGMMSVESYTDLQMLKEALDGIVNVKKFVKKKVAQAGFYLQWGKAKNGKKPLQLLDKNGSVISFVKVPVENFLSEAETKIADEEDVTASKNMVELGHTILILTLTSGDKVYVDLHQLVDVYTGEDSDSVTTTVTNNKVKSELKVSADDKMIYVDEKGVKSILQVVRKPKRLLFYGKKQETQYKIAEVSVPDNLIGYVFIEKADENTTVNYPCRLIDHTFYNEVTNPVRIGEPYFILEYSADNDDVSTNFRYNDYISLRPILKGVVLSTEEGQILTKDEQGNLYCSINWIDVQ